MNADKPVHARNVPTPTDRLRSPVPPEEIARDAEKLWRERGSPAGKDDAIWLETESRWVRLRVSTSGLRRIDKLGLEAVLAEIKATKKAKAKA